MDEMICTKLECIEQHTFPEREGNPVWRLCIVVVLYSMDDSIVKKQILG